MGYKHQNKSDQLLAIILNFVNKIQNNRTLGLLDLEAINNLCDNIDELDFVLRNKGKLPTVWKGSKQ